MRFLFLLAFLVVFNDGSEINVDADEVKTEWGGSLKFMKESSDGGTWKVPLLVPGTSVKYVKKI